jgi:hypothetical protein
MSTEVLFAGGPPAGRVFEDASVAGRSADDSGSPSPIPRGLFAYVQPAQQVQHPFAKRRHFGAIELIS